MKKYRLVVLSSARPFIYDFSNAMKQAPFVETYFFFESGSSLLNYLTVERNIDFIIIDEAALVSPFDLISRLARVTGARIIVLVQDLKSDSFLTSQGASLVLKNPANARIITRLLYDYIVFQETADRPRNLDKDSLLDKRIVEMLISCQFKCSIKGYLYLKDALFFLVKQQKRFAANSLYRSLASRHHTTAENVERAIRHSIKNCYQRNQNYRLGRTPTRLLFRGGPLSNGEFLCRAAEIVRLP